MGDLKPGYKNNLILSGMIMMILQAIALQVFQFHINLHFDLFQMHFQMHFQMASQ